MKAWYIEATINGETRWLSINKDDLYWSLNREFALSFAKEIVTQEAMFYFRPTTEFAEAVEHEVI